jgi:hypothetical protein
LQIAGCAPSLYILTVVQMTIKRIKKSKFEATTTDFFISVFKFAYGYPNQRILQFFSVQQLLIDSRIIPLSETK